MEVRSSTLAVLAASEVAAAAACGVTPNRLHERTRQPFICFPRQLAMTIAIENGARTTQVARYWRRHWATVHKAVRTVYDLADVYQVTLSTLQDARARLERELHETSAKNELEVPA